MAVGISLNANSGGMGAAQQGEAVLGQPIITAQGISLGPNPQPVNLINIDAYNGLPLQTLHFAVTVSDTTGNNAPAGVNPIESVIQRLQLQSLNGGAGSEPMIDFNGTYGTFTRWQRIKNVNGQYVASPTLVESAGGTTYSGTWNFDLNFHMPLNVFPLRPQLVLNGLGSRTTDQSLASSQVSIVVTADFAPMGNFFRTRLKTLYNMPVNSTGLQPLGPSLDKYVVAVQQAYDVGTDSNLQPGDSFNYRNQGQQIFTNLPYQNIITQEAQQYTASPTHINGFFPFYVQDKKPRALDNTTNLVMDFASAPTVGTGATYSNVITGFLEEAF